MSELKTVYLRRYFSAPTPNFKLCFYLSVVDLTGMAPVMS